MKLDEYLSSKNMTDAAFGELIQRQQSSVNRLRRGETRPDWKTIERIVEVTGGVVTPNDFLETAVEITQTDGQTTEKNGVSP